MNPNTMQRALAALEQSGLLRAERTAGRFVTEDSALIASVRRALAQEKIEAFVRDLSTLGYTRREMMDLMKETVEGEKQDD